MVRTCLAVAYASYLLFAGFGMAGGLSRADHPSARGFQTQLCRLAPDTPSCTVPIK